MPLLLLFILVPMIELLLLIRVGMLIGWAPTVLLIIVTGIVGASLAKYQGLQVWQAVNNDLASGKMPTEHLLSGLLVLIGAAFLLTPGMLTDAAGFFLMIPGNRRLVIPLLEKLFANNVQIHTMPGPFGGGVREAEEVRVVDEETHG